MTAPVLDRPAAIRRALRDLVAEHGLHGASMSAVAKCAGVATGTAYVHYESKEELVFATYLEIKEELANAVVAEVDQKAAPAERYAQMWMATFEHLRAQPSRAKFLAQLEASPLYERAHQLMLEREDALRDEAGRPDLVALLRPLPPEILFSMSLGVAVRLVAAGAKLSGEELASVVDGSWRAITVAGA